jgi:hypothetical protein
MSKADKKKKYHCPFCPHTSSRKGNMKVHIDRWHRENKEPLYVSDQTEALLKSKKDQHSPASGKTESMFDFINKLHGQVSEAKEAQRKMEEIKDFFGGNLSYVPRLYTNKILGNIAITNFGKPLMAYTSIPPLYANTSPPSFTFTSAMDSQGTRREEVVGFTAKVCEGCTKIVIETHYAVDEDGKDPATIRRSNHFCFCPLKPSTLQSKALYILDLSARLTELPSELKKAVKRWIGQDGYLVAFRLALEKANANIVDIYTSSRAVIDIPISSRAKTNFNLRNSDSYSSQDIKRTHQWALRVIENGQTLLNDDELIDFIKIADNRTAGYFRIRLDGQEYKANTNNSSFHSEIYCMFINKGPLPNKSEHKDNSMSPLN